MNSELESQILSLIDAAKQAGQDISSFIASQAPEVIQQMLLWETVRHSWIALICACFCFLFVWCAKKLSKLNDPYNYPPPAIPYAAAIIAALFSVFCVMSVVKIQIAPKIVILEKIGALAHGK